MALGAVDPLAAGRAHQRVIVQCRNHRNAARPGHDGQIEREVEQVVDVHDVRPHCMKHVLELFVDHRRPIGFFERPAPPVVDDLDHRQAVVHTPFNVAVRPGRIELGAHDRDVMT